MENEGLRNAEAAASLSVATESTLNSTSSSSWWLNMSLWSKGFDGATERQENKPADRNTKG